MDRLTFLELIPHFQQFFAGFPSSDFRCDFLSSNFFLRSTLFNSFPRSLLMLPHLLSSMPAVRSWRPFSFSKWSCRHYQVIGQNVKTIDFMYENLYLTTCRRGKSSPSISPHLQGNPVQIGKFGEEVSTSRSIWQHTILFIQ